MRVSHVRKDDKPHDPDHAPSTALTHELLLEICRQIGALSVASDGRKLCHFARLPANGRDAQRAYAIPQKPAHNLVGSYCHALPIRGNRPESSGNASHPGSSNFLSLLSKNSRRPIAEGM